MRYARRSTLLGILGAFAAMVLSPLPEASAQETTQVYIGGHAHTALGDAITAQARYVAATGYYVQSVAIARKIHAEAAAIEIDNTVKSVEAYWKRKEIWNEEFHKQHPTHTEWQAKFDEIYKRRIKEQYQDLVKADVTEHLNWMLRELSGPILAVQYSSKNWASDPASMNTKLGKRDLDLLWVTDGGKGSKLIFNLGDPKLLDKPWPLALRGDEFKELREEFEAARDAVVNATQDGKTQADNEGSRRLIKATSDLLAGLDEVYTHERRADVTVFLQYSDAQRFLRTMLGEVIRALNSSDRSLFDPQSRFKGESVADLVTYMYRNGLTFSKPRPGSEGVYDRLFMDMRRLYITFSADAGGDQGKGAGGLQVLPPGGK
jgi:hypothetical protein